MYPIVYYLALIPAIILAITCHECAHARVALWCGDRTALDQGRVSLNPLAHLDPVGTIMIFLVGFGWGKPVPVNSANFRHPRADAVVSAAGPLTNMVLACAGGWLYRTFIPSAMAYGHADVSLWQSVLFFLTIFVQINLALCFFNLIPLYPLDGSHVLENLLPLPMALKVRAFNARYGVAILMSLILLGYVTHIHVFSLVLGPPITICRNLLLGY